MSNDKSSVGLKDPIKKIPGGEDSEREDLVAELAALSESGKIKYTQKYIKKAGQKTLEKIKRDYDCKQLDEANGFISDNLISKFSELMDGLDMIENTDEMEKELANNQLLKRDLKNIIGQLTPYIPLVGLLCGGAIVGKHMFKGKSTEGATGDTGSGSNPRISDVSILQKPEKTTVLEDEISARTTVR